MNKDGKKNTWYQYGFHFSIDSRNILTVTTMNLAKHRPTCKSCKNNIYIYNASVNQDFMEKRKILLQQSLLCVKLRYLWPNSSLWSIQKRM